MKAILVSSLHICDYLAVHFLYGITLLMLSLSEMPGLDFKVPFTCVCRILCGPLVLLPNLQVFHFFLSTLYLRDIVVLTMLLIFSYVIFIY